MKLYALIHPYGGDMNKFNAGREICTKLRQKHPEMTIIFVLDNFVYSGENTFHTEINKWCETVISHCDGIIVPENWQNSDGCRVEIEAAEKFGKEIFSVNELI